MYNDEFLDKKLNDRKQQNAFRTLRITEDKIDFCSNDYLGIVKNNLLQPATGNRQLSKHSRDAARARAS